MAVGLSWVLLAVYFSRPDHAAAVVNPLPPPPPPSDGAAGDQAWLAERFASRIDDRFEGVDYELSQTGLPILRGVSAWFECHNRSRYPEGDHVIFVGEVERCEHFAKDGLIFHRGRLSGSSS